MTMNAATVLDYLELLVGFLAGWFLGDLLRYLWRKL